MFCESEVIKVGYDHFRAGNENRECEKFLVIFTGFGNSRFKCCYPFSWIIFQKINSLLDDVQKRIAIVNGKPTNVVSRRIYLLL